MRACVCLCAQIWAAKTFIFMKASKLCHSEISTMVIIQIQVIDLQPYLLPHTHTYLNKYMVYIATHKHGFRMSGGYTKMHLIMKQRV